MLGVAPADQERDQAAAHRAGCQAPSEHRSGGPDPLPVGHLAWVIAVAACPGGGRVDVVAGKRPADQAAAAYAIDAEGTGNGRLGLPGIGRDDLQIRLRAEREQRVVVPSPMCLPPVRARTPNRCSMSATAAQEGRERHRPGGQSACDPQIRYRGAGRTAAPVRSQPNSRIRAPQPPHPARRRGSMDQHHTWRAQQPVLHSGSSRYTAPALRSGPPGPIIQDPSCPETAAGTPVCPSQPERWRSRTRAPFRESPVIASAAAANAAGW
jgi:hypothetical protein